MNLCYANQMTDNKQQTVSLASVIETERMGAYWSTLIEPGNVLYFSGELGAGKTTWVRGFLKGLGYTGTVKSPTYTLVEPYNVGQYTLYHFDLYRLGSATELDSFGFRDYLRDRAIILVEWFEKGIGILPTPDIIFTLHHAADGRLCTIEACTPSGLALQAHGLVR